MDLFAPPGTARAGTALDSAVDRIRERFGNLALRRGSALPEARGAGADGADPPESTPSRQRERSALAQARRTQRPAPPRRSS
jgi:hypothetical protein